MKKQMPQIDIGLHIGSRYGAMHKPLKDSEQAFREEYHPTPHQIKQFRRGYVIGEINDHIRYLQFEMEWMRRDQLDLLRKEMAALAECWEMRLS